MEKDVELREKIVEISKRLYNRGLVVAASGNISARKPGSEEIFITPSGISKGYLKPSDVVKIDLKGKVLEGVHKPTSEAPMHIEIYKTRSDVNAVVHAHPPISTGFACASVPLDCSLTPETIVMIGDIAFVEYATASTEELGKAVAKYAKGYDAFLLENHGTTTLGANLEQAYQRTELLEELAKISLVSKILGGPRPLPQTEIKKLRGLQILKYRVELAKRLK